MTFIKFNSENYSKDVCYFLNRYDKLVDSNNQETFCKNEKIKINNSKKILTWGDNSTMSFEDFYFKNKNNIHKKLNKKGLNSNDFFKNYTNKLNTSNKNKKQKNKNTSFLNLIFCCTPYNNY